jgi:hypothetical protein
MGRMNVTRLAAALVAVMGCAPAHAWVLDWSLGLGVEHSDNLGRRIVDPQSGNRISPYLDVSATEEGESLQATIAGSVAYNRYNGVDFDSNFEANFGAELIWSLLPGRLLWTLENYASQQPIDVFATNSPDNVQNANVFSTGPTLLYRISENLAGRTEARYINSYAEETEAFNSDRFLLTSRMLRNLDEVSSLSGNVSLEAVRLDNPTDVAPDFDRFGVFAGYDRRGSRLSYRFDAGWNWVDAEGQPRRDGLLARANGTFALTDISSLEGSIRRELSDAAADLGAGAPDVDALLLPRSTGGSGGVSTLTGEVFELDRVDLAYLRTGERLTLRTGGYWSRQLYELSEDLDQRNRGISTTLDYALGQRSSAGVFWIVNWQDFTNTGFDTREEEYGLRYRVRLQRQLELNLEATRANRETSDPLNGFDEDRLYAGLVWRSR